MDTREVNHKRKIKIVPYQEAYKVFEDWWIREGQFIKDPKELASLAFDEGHTTHHKEFNY